MDVGVICLLGGVIFAIYMLFDRWIEYKIEINFQETERQRIANETAEFELEQRRDAYYGKDEED